MKKLVVLVAAAPLLVAAPTAEARTKICAKTAKVISGSVVVPGYDDPVAPGGHATPNSAKDVPVKRLSRTAVEYAVPAGKSAVVAVQGVRFRLSQEANFRYGCFGHSPAQGALYPRIALNRGKVVATTRAGRPGAVSTGMGMADPFADAAMTFEVKAGGRPEYPVVTMRRTAGDGKVNVTPYAGPRPGTCRQVGTARFAFTKKGPRVYYDGRRARR